MSERNKRKEDEEMKAIYTYKIHDLEKFIDQIKDKNVKIMSCVVTIYPNDKKGYEIMVEQYVNIDLKYVLDDIYEHIKSIILKYELDTTIFQRFNVLTLDEMKRVIKLIEKATDSITRDEYIDMKVFMIFMTIK